MNRISSKIYWNIVYHEYLTFIDDILQYDGRSRNVLSDSVLNVMMDIKIDIDDFIYMICL